MRLAIRNDFEQDVPEAFTMLTDPAFLDAVARGSHPVSMAVASDGRHTRTRRTFTTDPPLRRLVGPTITLVEETSWDEPVGSERTGHLSVTVEGLPASYEASVRLYPGGRGSLLDYDGDATVRVPLLGPSLEQQAVPLLRKAIDLQQRVADEWGA